MTRLAMLAALPLARPSVALRPPPPPASRRCVALASWRMGGGGGAPPSPARRAPSGSRAPRTRRGRGYADDDDARDDDDRDDRGAYGDPPPGEDWASARDFRRGAGSVGARRGRGRDRADDASFARGGGRRGGSRSGAPPSSSDAPHHRTVWQERHDEKKRSRVAPTLAESLVGEALYGLNPARAALLAGRRAVHAIFVQEASAAASDPTLVQAAADLGVPLTPVSKHDLNMLVGSGRPHNGVALDVDPIAPTPISSLPTTWWEEAESSDDANDDSAATNHTAPPPVWLALDEVVDPQNLGAVLRSAHFLGVDGVVLCAKNSAPLSPVVSKASSGAAEARETYASRGAMSQFLDRASRDGWAVVGAAADSRDAKDVGEVEVTGPTVLVVGNEGRGLRTNVRRACGSMVKIDGASHLRDDGDDPAGASVDSLNVSVATGILLHGMLASARRNSRSNPNPNPSPRSTPS